MYARAIRDTRSSERGSALVGTLVVLVSVLGLICAASTMATLEVKDARRTFDEVRTRYLAQAGTERGMHFLSEALKNTAISDPLHGVENLFVSGDTISAFVGEPVLNGGHSTGSYSVTLTALDRTATSITIAIDSTGYLPEAPADLPAGQRVASWHSTRTTVRFQLSPSEVFDYGYFINNWGWFYGDTIYCNGNVRSNGQFDAAGYSPTVGGQPLYDSVHWNGTTADLGGYRDDNGDGQMDGKDGGVFSGWDIVGAQNLKGQGAAAANQHDFQPQVPMPNLTDLTLYEKNAVDLGGSISVGGVVVANAVVGDEAGEHQNLFLRGTAANPIVLHGPVVVRGNVIISGYVTGQGAIYSGGNVYCPDSVRYKNPPASARPTDNSEASTEQWLSNNWNKDFLGLFARENVVIGDFTDPVWQFYEAWWMADSLNSSAEDSGADGIPHTLAGRDGVLGTADDDVLEGDGIFTIQHYTETDLALGLIPAGKSVGDPIPGTGEDIDGDGVYDDAATLADVILTTPLDSANWNGNMPAGGIANYHSIASMSANNLDAVFYTNHSFCYTVLGSQAAHINGALVSRNEDIVYGTPSVDVNYDCRLLGGTSGLAAGFLPLAVQPLEVLRWVQLDRDPNRYLVHP